MIVCLFTVDRQTDRQKKEQKRYRDLSIRDGAGLNALVGRKRGKAENQNKLLPLLGLWPFVREEREKEMISRSRPSLPTYAFHPPFIEVKKITQFVNNVKNA